MTRLFPPAPAIGQPMLAARPSADARTLLALRRSANKLMITAPGPTASALDQMLEIAARVPDHHKLSPWRFIVFEGEARAQFGEVLMHAFTTANPAADAKDVHKARDLFLRAPSVVAVISAPVDDGRTPRWEQELSAGAACMTLLIAANASGFAGCWLTEWPAYNSEVHSALGMAPGEKIAGFIYLGTAVAAPPERARVESAALIRRWKPD